MNRNKLLVLVNRQLDTELRLLDRLEKICACFTANALESVSDNTSPPRFQFLEELLQQFQQDVASTMGSRQSVLQLIGQFDSIDISNVSVRRIIQNSEEPFRTQLEEKRLAIVNRIYELKVQLAGDSAAVFYSYDFYRRIVNSLIGSNVEETEYRCDGKSIDKNSGKLYEKAC